MDIGPFVYSVFACAMRTSCTKLFHHANEWLSALTKEIQLHRINLNLLVVFEALMQEASVAGVAAKLSKTPSAVSHALARLREQVGDPLIVKVGGRMQASSLALQLIEDIRPILSGIKRVLQLPAPFDPMSAPLVPHCVPTLGKGPFGRHVKD
jgi:hypothetical protein